MMIEVSPVEVRFDRGLDVFGEDSATADQCVSSTSCVPHFRFLDDDGVFVVVSDFLQLVS